MREPHWLAGTTSRSVTGGLLVAVLLLIELVMSLARRSAGHQPLASNQSQPQCPNPHALCSSAPF